MVFGEGILDRLPEHSVLHSTDNPFRKVFIKSIGALLDDFDLDASMEAPYLQEATGVYLDLHGKDLGVKRRVDETDEHYRNRLIYETLGYLTIRYLQTVYDLTLYVYTNNFNINDNTLTSDNTYIGMDFMSITSSDIRKILGKKFPLNNGLVWIRADGSLDKIIIDSVNVIIDYLGIYTTTDLRGYFWYNTDITEVVLDLPSAIECNTMFYGCTGLTNVSLDLPSVTYCASMFYGCTGLTNVSLDLPSVTACGSMFEGCTGLTSVELDLPSVLYCGAMFYGCTGLTSVELDLPSALNCGVMFHGCTGLTDVTLNIPELDDYTNIFYNCSALESINVTIPNGIVADFKSYVLGLSLSNLTSFIINGEEVEL